MYACIFESGKEPELIETALDWVHKDRTVRVEKTYAYFYATNNWGICYSKLYVQVATALVPPEYRTYILILT